MSNEEKQIEEMANITRVWCEIDNSCGSCHWETCNECLAECLYKAGYRKASDVAREIFAEIERIAMSKIDGDLSIAVLNDTYYIEAIDELKKKYESEDNK